MSALGDRAAAEGEQEVIGGVYGIEIPPVVKFRNGYEQGAKYINPDINVLGVYLPSFTDPAAGGQAANQEIGDGADVIFGAGGPTGTGGIKEAAQQGVLVIGVDQDEFLTSFGNGDAPGAENLISSAVKRVDQAVFLAIEALANGGEGFPGGSNLILSASNDGVGFAEPHDADVPEEVLAQMEQILAGLKDGSIVTGVDPASGALLPDVGTALEAAGVSGFIAAVEAAGMTESMAAFQPGMGVTLLVPSDEALAAAGDMAPEDFSTVLASHAVLGAHTLADLVSAGTVSTFGGDFAVTAADDGTVTIGDATVVTGDILFDHGVIHVIDTVLAPPAP
jgi:hypothetical protein